MLNEASPLGRPSVELKVGHFRGCSDGDALGMTEPRHHILLLILPLCKLLEDRQELTPDLRSDQVVAVLVGDLVEQLNLLRGEIVFVPLQERQQALVPQDRKLLSRLEMGFRGVEGVG